MSLEHLEVHQAVLNGDMGRLLTVLDQTPDLVDRRNITGWTPLHVAAYAGNEEAAALLLSRGAQLHARDRLGRTALEIASEAGHQALVRLLGRD